MKKLKNKKVIGFFTILMLLLLTLSVISNANLIAGPELEISSITGKIGKVRTEVKNIGDEDAKKVVITIKVTGGFLKRINMTKVCSGCGQCNTTIVPNASKIEFTDKIIFGLGNLDITVTAEAENAEKVTSTKKGLLLGFIVIVQ